MKKVWLTISMVVFVLVIGRAALGQMHKARIEKEVKYCGMMGGMMEQGMMGTGMMGPGMMAHGMMMQGNMGCPMMMNLLRSVDYYLSYKEEIGLSEEQIKSLKSIRDSYQKDAIQMTADLHVQMLDLNNLLSEDEIDLSKAGELNKRIEATQTEMRFKNIEAFVKAKRVLDKEQLKKVRTLSMGHYGEEAESSRGMMHRSNE